jgi:exopolysaccharide biosynthesis polyprenyl glycosylphosphotransferase
MLLAAIAATELGATAAGVEHVPVVWLVIFPLLVLVGLYGRSMYDWHIRLQALDDVRVVLVTTALAGMTVLSLRVITGGAGDDLSAQTLRLWAFAAFYVAAGRVAIHWSQVRARTHGDTAKPTLVVGAGRVGRLTAKRLLEHPEFGLKPVGFLDKEPRRDPAAILPVLGASWDLEQVISDHAIEHVVVTFSTAPNEVLLREMRRCEELGVSVSLVPRLFERVTGKLSVEHIGGLPLLSARRPNPKGWQFAVKYAADRVVAAFLLLLVLPLLVAAAVAVRISVGSPIFFRQRRIGLDGREFEMLKFRTMRGSPADGEADADWAGEQLGAELPVAAKPAERTTRVGRLLRTASIDELPQLLNVLLGQMSIVGPRPERSAFVRMFEGNVYRYEERHRVKSGITGWAQVNGLRGKTSLSDRVEWDNYYIENWSLWLDVKILLQTLLAVPKAFSHSD